MWTTPIGNVRKMQCDKNLKNLPDLSFETGLSSEFLILTPISYRTQGTKAFPRKKYWNQAWKIHATGPKKAEIYQIFAKKAILEPDSKFGFPKFGILVKTAEFIK